MIFVLYRFQYSDTWREAASTKYMEGEETNDNSQSTESTDETSVTKTELITPMRRAKAFFSRSATGVRFVEDSHQTVSSVHSVTFARTTQQVVDESPGLLNALLVSDLQSTSDEPPTVTKAAQYNTTDDGVIKIENSTEEDDTAKEGTTKEEFEEMEASISVTVSEHAASLPPLKNLKEVAKLFSKGKKRLNMHNGQALKKMIKNYEGELKSFTGKTLADFKAGEDWYFIPCYAYLNVFQHIGINHSIMGPSSRLISRLFFNFLVYNVCAYT